MEKLKVIKIGGNLIEDEAKFSEFLKDFVAIEGKKILVHGGGNKATEISSKLGIESKKVDGRRITSAAAMEVITMVYGGLINKNVVARLQKLGCNAIGLSGADANVLQSVKRPVKDIDFGMVGDMTGVNNEFISEVLKNQVTPVFCAISFDGTNLLNTNADSIASAIATACSEDFEVELLYVLEKKGVLMDVNDDSSIIEKIDSENYKKLLDENVIFEGMIPKLHNCFEAIEHGVSAVRLGDYQLLSPHSKFTKIIA